MPEPTFAELISRGFDAGNYANAYVSDCEPISRGLNPARLDGIVLGASTGALMSPDGGASPCP